MARSIVNELFDRLIDTFPANQTYTSDDLAADPMPPPVAHFLRHLLQHQAAQEMPHFQSARSTWIDADHPEVKQARRAYRDALNRHTQFPASEWKGALRRALQRVTAYLIHPTQTLTHFVYGNQNEPLSPSTVRQRIQFFSPYQYLHEAINQYLEKHPEATVERDRFEQLLRRVDTEMTSDYTADEWVQLLRPLFNLMQVGTSDQEVPTPFLHTFFEEKDANAIARRLQRASVQRGTTSFSPDDLRQIIRADEIPTAPARPRSSETPSAPAEDADPRASDQPTGPTSTSEPESPPEPEPTPEPDQPTPLWKKFRQGNAPTAPAPEPDTPSPEEPDEEQPLWTQFRPDTEPDESAPAELTALERDVLGPRGSSNRALFIRKLFGGDRESYQHTLERLRDAPSWSRASQIIAQDVFRAHQVNIYSDPAVTFTDAVEEQFKKG